MTNDQDPMGSGSTIASSWNWAQSAGVDTRLFPALVEARRKPGPSIEPRKEAGDPFILQIPFCWSLVIGTWSFIGHSTPTSHTQR